MTAAVVWLGVGLAGAAGAVARFLLTHASPEAVATRWARWS